MLTGSGPSSDGTGYELSGLVLGVIEDGGSCTFTLTRGTTAITRAQKGLSDATDTACGTVTVPATDLSPGTWSATLTYTNPVGAVTSEPTEVTVR